MVSLRNARKGAAGAALFFCGKKSGAERGSVCADTGGGARCGGGSRAGRSGGGKKGGEGSALAARGREMKKSLKFAGECVYCYCAAARAYVIIPLITFEESFYGKNKSRKTR